MSEQSEALTAAKAMQFNENVHEVTESGDPKRKEDHSICLKKNWKKVAKDRQSRTFNPHVHGKEAVLDDDGFLKVQRHKPKAENFSSSRSKAFVAQYHKEGYHEYLANDLGGVPEKMLALGYEVVTNKEGAARMPVGATRQENTTATLYRIPIEWYEANQREKRKKNEQNLEVTRAPKAADGQYKADPDSPLR